MNISLCVNGKQHTVEIQNDETLLVVLRRLGYKSVKYGCGEGFCGACTVIMDQRPINSCLVLAATANGKDIETVDNMADINQLNILQQSFIDAGSVQCGFCTPGMLLVAKTLLAENPDPSVDDIKEALDGNLCRCTGYVQIIEGVQLAAKRMRESEAGI